MKQLFEVTPYLAPGREMVQMTFQMYVAAENVKEAIEKADAWIVLQHLHIPDFSWHYTVRMAKILIINKDEAMEIFSDC